MAVIYDHNIRICPYCGGVLHLIEEPHPELGISVYKPSYYECFECGGCYNKLDIELSDDNYLQYEE